MAIQNTTLENALAPYRGSPAFSAGPSWDLLRAYVASVQKAGLILSDADIAAGVKRFGAWHVAQFGEGITAWSSPTAVAAQSVEEAISVRTGKPAYTSPFWSSVAASGDLAKGDQAGMLAGQIAYRNQPGMSYGSFGFFEQLIQAAIPIAMSAAVGGALAGEFAGAFGEAVAVPGLEATAADLAAIDFSGGLVPEFGGLDMAAAAASDLAAADAAAGLVPEYGAIAQGATPTIGNAVDVVQSIANTGTTGENTMSFFVDENGVLDLYSLAAQDYADFGVQGVQDLGESLNYSNGLDWVSNTINASNPAAVNDIFGSISNAIKGVGNVVKAAAGSVASTRTAITAANRVQPNYTAAVGSVNLGMLAIGAAAWLALR